MVDISSSGTTPLFKFNIIKLATDVINEINRFRSYSPVVNNEKIKNDSLPNESVVNTFFRLIGFPSIVSIKAVYENVDVIGAKQSDAIVLTPGFKLGFFIENAIISNTNKNNLTVPGPNGIVQQTIHTALLQRHTQLMEIESKIGSRSSNVDRIIAFRKPLSPRMDFFGKHQERNVFKRLSPFMTAYNDIYPGTHELARPFLQNAKDGFLVNEELKRPFIETVIRIRLVNTDGGGDANTKNYISKLFDLLNAQAKVANENKKELENMVKLLPESGTLLEAFIIQQLLFSVSKLAKRWAMLIKSVDETLKDTEVALAPSTASSKQSLLGKQKNSSSSFFQMINSEEDERIKLLEARVRKSDAIIGLLPIQDSVAKMNYGQTQPSARNIMSNALTSSFISVLRQDLDYDRKELESLKRKKIDRSQKADQLRVELEMMTGEFFGLSITDIVFTMISLFLIEKKDLLYLLDNNVISEMKQDSVLNSILEQQEVSSTTPDLALSSLKKIQQKVSDLYDLFNLEVNIIKDKTKKTNVPNRNKSGNSSAAKSNKVERTIDINKTKENS